MFLSAGRNSSVEVSEADILTPRIPELEANCQSLKYEDSNTGITWYNMVPYVDNECVIDAEFHILAMDPSALIGVHYRFDTGWVEVIGLNSSEFFQSPNWTYNAWNGDVVDSFNINTSHRQIEGCGTVSETFRIRLLSVLNRLIQL